MLLHSAVTVAHRSCQPNTAVRPQMQWSSGVTVWANITRGTLFGKLNPLKDARVSKISYNFTFFKENQAHRRLTITLYFGKL